MSDLSYLISFTQDEIQRHLAKYPSDQVASWLAVLTYTLSEIDRRLDERPKPYPGLNFIGG